MVREGIYYAIGMVIAAVILGLLTTPWLALIPLVLAAFFLNFFRDPERDVPTGEGLIVSPADGKVTDIAPATIEGRPYQRISIFLNVFDVHVNRSPAGGRIMDVKYKKGKFGNAMASASSEDNEQNLVTLCLEDGQYIYYKQIAGLLARRIVFWKRAGEEVKRGERIGMMKFSSRMDVFLPANAEWRVQLNQKVVGGSTIIAWLPYHQDPKHAPDVHTGARS